MDVQPQPTSELKKLGSIVDDVRIAMLTTEEPDGSLRSRPLVTLQMDDSGGLWFMTSVSSPKISEMDAHRRVNLSYTSPGRQRYASVSGITQIIRDEEKARELWTLALRPWFP